jgi:hypothetical protein
MCPVPTPRDFQLFVPNGAQTPSYGWTIQSDNKLSGLLDVRLQYMDLAVLAGGGVLSAFDNAFGWRQGKALIGTTGLLGRELRGQRILFPGTVWHTTDKKPTISYTYWDGNSWPLCWAWLGILNATNTDLIACGTPHIPQIATS